MGFLLFVGLVFFFYSAWNKSTFLQLLCSIVQKYTTLESGKHIPVDGDELIEFVSSEAFGPDMDIWVLLPLNMKLT